MSGDLLPDSRAGSQQTAGTLVCKISMPIVNKMDTTALSIDHECMRFLHGCGFIQSQNCISGKQCSDKAQWPCIADTPNLVMLYHYETCYLATGDAM